MSDFLTFKRVKIISYDGDVLFTTLGDYMLYVRKAVNKCFLFLDNRTYSFLLVRTTKKNLWVLNKVIERVDELMNSGARIIDIKDICDQIILLEDM